MTPDLLKVANIMREALAVYALPNLGKLSAKQALALDKNRDGVMDVTTGEDRPTELFLNARLSVLTPGAVFIGEETARQEIFEQLQGRVWIVDPIDGTNNYAFGKSGWGTLVSYAKAGEVLASWILQIYEDEGELNLRIFMAEKGKGIVCSTGETLPFIQTADRETGVQKWQIRKDAPTLLAESLSETDFMPLVHQRPTSNRPASWINPGYFRPDIFDADRFDRLIASGKTAIDWQKRDFFSAVDAFIAMLEGWVPVLISAPGRPWDYTAGVFLVRELGGAAKRLDDGEPVHFSKYDGGLAVALEPALIGVALAECFGHSDPLGTEPCVEQFLTIKPAGRVQMRPAARKLHNKFP